jgi:hypothetical protein
MGDYYHSHILRLKKTAGERFERPMQLLTPDAAVHLGNKEVVGVNGCAIRIAVDDFATILKEIRRLK